MSWRDVQRLSVENAVIVNPGDSDWRLTGANRTYNHKYGFGTFDTYQLIQAAKKYQVVNPQTSIVSKSDDLGLSIPQGLMGVAHALVITEADIIAAGMKRLEHITVTVLIEHQRRGDIAIHLTSPSKFVSRLVEVRSFDSSDSGFPNWKMMSVAHW